MKISDICSAKGLKFKLTYENDTPSLSKGNLIEIENTQKNAEFLVNPYGVGCENKEVKPFLCKADDTAAQYLHELFNTENSDPFRCMFSVEGVNRGSIEVQAYTFKSVVEYKTTIFIQVTDELLKKTTLENLYQEYVWAQLGEPALFCLNYKNRKKQTADVRFL